MCEVQALSDQRHYLAANLDENCSHETVTNQAQGEEYNWFQCAILLIWVPNKANCTMCDTNTAETPTLENSALYLELNLMGDLPVV